MAVSMNNSGEIIATTIYVSDGNKITDFKELCLSTYYDINNIVGLPVEGLNLLQKVSEHIHSDADLFGTIMQEIKFKSNTTYVNTQVNNILLKILN
jgi:hypothetical protein